MPSTLLVALGGHGQRPPSGPEFAGDDSARGVLVLDTPPASSALAGGGELQMRGRVAAGTAAAGPAGASCDWLVDARRDRLYRVPAKRLLPSLGRREQPPAAAAAPCDDSCAIGGDVTSDGRFALVYGGGEVAVVALDSGGDVAGPVPGSRRQLLPHYSGTFDPRLADRQAQSTPHQAKFDVHNNFALLPDLGCDRVWCYSFDKATGLLSEAPTALVLPQGSGPRHLDFHPGGAFLYINWCETTQQFMGCGASNRAEEELEPPWWRLQRAGRQRGGREL